MKGYFTISELLPGVIRTSNWQTGLASARNLLPNMNESMSNKETKQVVRYKRMTWDSKCFPEISIALKRLKLEDP